MTSAVASPHEVAPVDVACGSCGAALRIPTTELAAECPYCGSTSIVDRPETRDRPDPAFVLPFVVDRDRAVSAVRQWIASRGPFVTSDFKRAARVEKAHAVYLPAYLYGAVAHTDYRADIGEDYTVTESYTTTDSQGKTVVRTRTRIETEWRPLGGRRSEYLRDVLVSASRALDDAELQALEPFDLRALRRFDPAFVSGFSAEEPSRARDACIDQARAEGTSEIGAKLARFMPGDRHRNLRHDTELVDEVADLVLVPVWVFALRHAHDAPPTRILLNGQTGEIAGRAPISKVKVGVAIAIAVLVVCVVVVLLGVGSPGAR